MLRPVSLLYGWVVEVANIISIVFKYPSTWDQANDGTKITHSVGKSKKKQLHGVEDIVLPTRFTNTHVTLTFTYPSMRSWSRSRHSFGRRSISSINIILGNLSLASCIKKPSNSDNYKQHKWLRALQQSWI